MTPEGAVKARIKALLSSYDECLYYEAWVPSGYGKQGLDYNACAAGRALYIEAKRPGGDLTPRQRVTLRKAYLAGGACFIISTDEGLAALARWLDKTIP